MGPVMLLNTESASLQKTLAFIGTFLDGCTVLSGSESDQVSVVVAACILCLAESWCGYLYHGYFLPELNCKSLHSLRLLLQMLSGHISDGSECID